MMLNDQNLLLTNTMLQRYDELYSELLTELKSCREKKHPFLIETEFCFHAAEKFMGILRDEVLHAEFSSREEEVHFFKHIKPKFVAESDYASLLNFAGNFCPNNDNPGDLIAFWKRQVDRLEKFKEKYREFYGYYVSGQTNLDNVYFTRSSPGDKTDSNYDMLAGQLLARQRYAAYAEEQLKGLQQKK